MKLLKKYEYVLGKLLSVSLQCHFSCIKLRINTRLHEWLSKQHLVKTNVIYKLKIIVVMSALHAKLFLT
jgi:hypothetical protein